MSGNRTVNESRLAGSLEYLHDTYLKAPGLLDPEDLRALRDHDLISSEQADKSLADLREIQEELPLSIDREIIGIRDYMARIDPAIVKKWDGKGMDIRSNMWKPETPEVFDPEYVRFIKSTHKRFCDLDVYEPFYLYILQRDAWMADPNHSRIFTNSSERDRYRAIERARCRANLLYMTDKYGRLKDGDPELGEDIFEGTLAHAHMFFLFDQGRSVFEAKVRQMGSSVAKGFMAVKTIAMEPDTLQVMIANDKESGEALLEQKVKWAFNKMPDWMRPKPINTPAGYFRVTFSADGTLTQSKADSSEIEVRTPAIEAINSRHPRKVYIDEASFIPIFDAMMFEARPTLFRYSKALGRRVMKNQLIAFSTGGRAKSGNGSYEREFRGEVEKWRHSDYASCITPVFYDWTTQPGITMKDYLREMKVYQAGSKEGHTHLSLQERMAQFRQHYPGSIDDVFLTSAATLVPKSIIINNIDRINKYEHQNIGVEYGRFDPVLGQEKMPQGSPFKFKIVGANWIPSADGDAMSPIQIWQHPYPGWEWRYFKGTDPIEADTGTSNFSSAVWDAHFGTMSASLNHRSDDPLDCYLQSVLLNKYYSNNNTFIPELVEVDLGKDYMSFMSGPWANMRRALVGQWQLPEYMQGKSAAVSAGHPDRIQRFGISSKNGRNKYETVQRLKDLILSHGKKIHHHEVFSQLLHFVGTPIKGASGGTKWATEDREKHQDDLLMALAYAYLCRLCYASRVPALIELKDKSMMKKKAQRERLQLVMTEFGPQAIRV